MQKIFILLILVIINAYSYGQQPSANPQTALVLSARSYSDRIVLRYDPTTPILFHQANKVGYIVERANYTQGISLEKLNFEAIKGSPFVRWEDVQWKKALNDEMLRDSASANLAALAMAYSDQAINGGDLLKDGLTSLKEQQSNADMRYGFSLIAANRSRVAAEGLGIGVVDPTVTLGQTYVYRVRINQPIQNPAIDWVYIKVTCENFNDKYLRNDKLVKVVEDDGSITFSFPESVNYYAFTFERSDNDGLSYQKIIKTPVLNFRPTGFDGIANFAYRDSSLTDYKKYHYRIFVSTVFADELVLAEFIAMPRDKTPPSPPFLRSALHVKPNQVELNWETKDNSSGDLKGFTITRGVSENGEYQPISKGILPATSNSYIDQSFDQEGSNYYIVEAVDTAGNSSRSYPAYVTLIDSTPPAIPAITSAKIDSVGKIFIKVKPNSEKDFMGYQLLKANAKEHEFSIVLETFKDSLGRSTFTMNDSTTLNTLTKKIYYKVIAFDTHFNQSASSEIIELTKRDTIPPVSPLITGFAVNDSSVVLRFANSSSEDVVRNILLRRESANEKFDTLFSNSDLRISQFTDAKIGGGKQYEYAMIAKDDGGLQSKPSKSIYVKTILNNRIPMPKLDGSFDGKTKKITLSFLVDKQLENQKLKVELYKRSDKNAAWINFKNIDFEKGKAYQDDPEPGQNGMIYTVRLTDGNQKSSKFSNELELKFNQ